MIIILNDISCQNLFINNDVSCNNIDISNNIFIGQDISINGKMDISGNIITKSDISCVNMDICNNASIGKDLTINGELIVKYGDITIIGNNNFFEGDGSKLRNVGKHALEVWNDASFTNIDVSNNVDISGILNVIDNVIFKKDLYIDNDLTVNRNLIVDGFLDDTNVAIKWVEN